MKIHAVRCATVTVKEAHRTARFAPLPLRLADIVLSTRYTEPLPVWTWVIEHPEGVIVVDTGENIGVFSPGYYSSTNDLVHNRLLHLKLDFTPEDQIAPQLERLGIRPADVRWVVQTHLHTDHSGGMHAFPKAQIMIAGDEWRQPLGAVPEQFPKWLNPTLVEYTDGTFYAFPRSQHLTQAGDVWLLPTPGHTAGHQSVAVQDGDQVLFLAGDASFNADQVTQDRIAGIVLDGSQAHTSLHRIKHLARAVPLVYMPSHDAESANRLAARQTTSFNRQDQKQGQGTERITL